MIVTLVVIGALALIAVVAYKHLKAGKTVTTGSVVAAVESDVKAVATDVKNDVSKI